ncbi:MAG: type III PLP-dependent enzyme [Pseudomonadota bacterium]
MERHLSPLSFVSEVPAYDPVICARPEKAMAAAQWFVDNFDGDVLYAVKVNPEPWMIDAIYSAGVRWFDVASEAELELIAERCPEARLAFMHPVKSRRAISRAYHEFGCNIFALDCEAELQKIIEETGGAKDLQLIIRIKTSGAGSALPLTGKFGAAPADVPGLLRAARAYADELGVCFHVGSQCMDPQAYRDAMADASSLIVDAGVTVDIVDVGGGFPAVYPGMTPPPLSAYMDAIHAAFEDMMVLENADFWCEPGRAIAAEGASLLTRVDLVRDDAVFLNDGGYGALYDAVHERWAYPVRVIGADGRIKADTECSAFRVYGPTCDSADQFAAPLNLPASIAEGDYVEFGNLGAYGTSMATRFNGFGDYETVAVSDAPFASAYAQSAEIVPFTHRRRAGG